MKQGEKMLKKLTQQATDLILHSIASGEVMGANLLITKGNEELVYAQAGMADREAEKPHFCGASTFWKRQIRARLF